MNNLKLSIFALFLSIVALIFALSVRCCAQQQSKLPARFECKVTATVVSGATTEFSAKKAVNLPKGKSHIMLGTTLAQVTRDKKRIVINME